MTTRLSLLGWGHLAVIPPGRSSGSPCVHHRFSVSKAHRTLPSSPTQAPCCPGELTPGEVGWVVCARDWKFPELPTIWFCGETDDGEGRGTPGAVRGQASPHRGLTAAPGSSALLASPPFVGSWDHTRLQVLEWGLCCHLQPGSCGLGQNCTFAELFLPEGVGSVCQ